MNQPESTIRRATVDDLKQLVQLWETAKLPVLESERHLTEFQIVVDPTGQVIGAIGLHIKGKHGKLHSDAFVEPEHEDEYRPKLWERLHSVARNHGLVRLWTLEEGPFWHQSGFEPATEEVKKVFPADFGDAHAAWTTLKLRDEPAEVANVEREFELFQMQQEETTRSMMRQARVFKVLAWVFVFLFLGGVGALLLKVMTRGNLPF